MIAPLTAPVLGPVVDANVVTVSVSFVVTVIVLPVCDTIVSPPPVMMTSPDTKFGDEDPTLVIVSVEAIVILFPD